MSNEQYVASDMVRFGDLFRSVVWPRVKYALPLGWLEREERHDHPSMVDVKLGIDWWLVTAAAQFGLAVRVQEIRHGKTPYDTFSIRYGRGEVGVELWSRLRQIKVGQLRPSYTIHGYVRRGTGEFLSAAVVDSDPLYLLAEQRFERLPKHQNRQSRGDADFISIKWSDITDPSSFNLMVCKRGVGWGDGGWGDGHCHECGEETFEFHPKIKGGRLYYCSKHDPELEYAQPRP